MWLGKRGFYNKVSPTVPYAREKVNARMEELALEGAKGSIGDSKKSDFLTKFILAKDDNPEIITDNTVLGLTLTMVNAGSDTTSTALSAFFYYILRQPEKMRRLVDEVDSHFPNIPATDQATSFDQIVVSFSDSQKLPYLDACLKETFRFHPSLGGMVLERITPAEGATICGEFIPGNTRVCCNAWITHRYKQLFGDDADEFRPERWLECSTEQASLMNKSLITFGSGPHTCIGKSIALLELYKVIPSLLRAFTVSFSSPSSISPAVPELWLHSYHIGLCLQSSFILWCQA